MSISARVAIITRTKNRTVLLRRAVDSVLQQRFQDWCHVIVNDGGDAAAVDTLVQPLMDAYHGRLYVIHNPHSVGMEAASNIGLRASDSEYAVIHDDDDSWHPDFLMQSVAYLDAPPATLKTPVAGVVCHSVRVLERIDGETVTETGRESFNSWMKGVSLYRLAASNAFPPISFLFSRQAMEKIGAFREDLPVLGDWDFHLRFALSCEIGLISKELAYYHHREDLQSGIYGNSVIAGDDKHRRYEHLYRNQLLREDLAAGRCGLGFLVNMAGSFEVLHDQMSIFERLLTRLRRVRLLRWMNRMLRKAG